MPVSSQHQDYSTHAERANQVRACVKSLDAKTGADYIIKRASEAAESDSKAFNRRVSGAIFTNYTGRTFNGLSGAVFRTAPNYQIPPASEHLVENADRMGTSLTQVIKRIFRYQMQRGFCLVVADFPRTDPNRRPTVEQMQNSDIQSYISTYSSSSVINYRCGVVNGKQALMMVVLEESGLSYTDDEFQGQEQKSYRVLQLVQGIYTVRMFDETGKEDIEQQYQPRDKQGRLFTYIPAYWASAEENIPGYYDPPLYDISTVNIGHYRNSADREHNLAIHAGGHVMIATSMDAEQFKAANPGGVAIGDNTGTILSEGSTWELLQLQSSDALSTAMQDKERNIVQLGAKIIEKTSLGDETAEAARMRTSSEHSVLDTVVDNNEDAITKAIQDCARFDGSDPAQVKVTLNRKYWWEKINAQEAMALIQLHDIGALRKNRIVELLQESGIEDAEKSIDDILGEITDQSPI